MMRDCTEFHSKCGPLGPFFNNAAIRLSPDGSQRLGLVRLCPDFYPEPYRGWMQRKYVTCPYCYLKSLRLLRNTELP